MRKPAEAPNPKGAGAAVRRRVAVVAGAALLLIAVVSSNTTAAVSYGDWSAPVNLGSPINTSGSENAPALSADGLSLYFSATRAGGFGGSDLWVSRRPAPGAGWGEPVNLGSAINTSAADNYPALSDDGHWLFFMSARPGGFGGHDLYQAYRPDVRDDLGWQAPTNLGANVNSAADDNGAGYFENGGHPQLFFTSNRPGGATLPDLYLTERQPDGTWGVASLIPDLSSSSYEQRPSIRSDGLEIFFHSNRPGSMDPVTGDLWTATRSSTAAPWSTPVNLAPLNTTENDINVNLSADGRTLLWASQRSGGLGGFDIWMATREQVLPATKDECKDGGWERFGVFKNQGDCVSWVATDGKNPPG